MSYRLLCELKVAEAVETVLRGYRLSPDPELARVAAEKEIENAKELKKLRAQAGQQAELELRTARAA